MADIVVDLAERSYCVKIVSGIMNHLGEEMKKLRLGKKVLVVSDENVAPLYGDKVIANLRAAGFAAEIHVVKTGEASKSLETAMELYTAAIEYGMDRKSTFLALGGGIVGDLTGFAAATYLRGVSFVQVPTTLLSQVDSSVGGKVAVNHPAGKNLIGAFYQPCAVFIDCGVLATLPKREFSVGMAEVIKYGLLDDGDFLTWLERNLMSINEHDAEILTEMIARSCASKARIVEKDETESGLRMTLNLGHTIAHAVEACGGFKRYNHGEAVAIGLHGALQLSRIAGLSEAELTKRIVSLLQEFALPVKAIDCKTDELLGYIAHDKKMLDGAVRWILLEKPGCIKILNNLTVEQIKAGLREII